WSQYNQLSGGVADASFKGFSSTTNVSPPSCGGTWKSAPGNGAKPPVAGAVPSYMAVVVASQISSYGVTLSGDVRSVLVVKTDQGYAPDPSHAGTGTIVAKVCGP